MDEWIVHGHYRATWQAGITSIAALRLKQEPSNTFKITLSGEHFDQPQIEENIAPLLPPLGGQIRKRLAASCSPDGARWNVIFRLFRRQPINYFLDDKSAIALQPCPLTLTRTLNGNSQRCTVSVQAARALSIWSIPSSSPGLSWRPQLTREPAPPAHALSAQEGIFPNLYAGSAI